MTRSKGSKRRGVAERAVVPAEAAVAARPASAGDRSAAGAVSPRAIRLSWWLAALALAASPLVFAPGILDAFRLPQRLLVEWLALASLVPLAWSLAFPGRRGTAADNAAAGPLSFRPSGVPTALVAAGPLLLLAALGLFSSPHPLHVRAALWDLAIGVAALVGWSLAFPLERLRRLLDVLVVPGVVLSVVGVLQVHHIWEPYSFAEAMESERQAITSLAGNPGDLAAFLVLPCLVAQVNLREPGRRRTFWALALLFMLYALVGSETLTSLLAVLAGSAVLWAQHFRRGGRALLGAGLVGSLLLAVVLSVPTVRERLLQRWNNKLDLAEVLSGRTDGWRVAWGLLQRHPLTGVGHGAYRAEFAPEKLRLELAGESFYGGHVRPSFANAHNEYLEMAADLGWPGVLAMLWAVAVLVRALLRPSLRPPGSARALGWGGLVAIALLALAYFPFRLAPVAFAWIAWIAWLLVAGEADPAEVTT